ncbi:40S ribosomal protein, partial [Halocaridina rubra]
MGISRDHWHERRATGGKRLQPRKKRKFELGRPAAMTKLGPQRIHTKSSVSYTGRRICYPIAVQRDFFSGVAALKADGVSQVPRTSLLPLRGRRTKRDERTPSSFPSTNMRSDIVRAETRPSPLLQYSSSTDNLGYECHNISESSTEEIIISASAKQKYLRVKLNTGSIVKLSYYHLRNECQCPKCYGHTPYVDSAMRPANVQ